jgi:ABC-type multidrug transport system permease subunit
VQGVLRFPKFFLINVQTTGRRGPEHRSEWTAECRPQRETIMERLAQQLLYWTPRALCILFAVFISIFALDVFQEGRGFWQTALALLMHLLPTFLLLAVLVISWRREWFGGILFIVFGILYIFWAWNKPFVRWYIFLLMAGPPMLVGALFLFNWRHRAELRPGS